MSTLSAPRHEYARLLRTARRLPRTRAGPTACPSCPRRPTWSTSSSPSSGSSPTVVLGAVPTREVVVTAEHVAINAVMAGCQPEYMPVVVAAVPRPPRTRRATATASPARCRARRRRSIDQRTGSAARSTSTARPGASARAGAPTPPSGARCGSSSATCAAPSPASSTAPASPRPRATRSASARTRRRRPVGAAERRARHRAGHERGHGGIGDEHGSALDLTSRTPEGVLDCIVAAHPRPRRRRPTSGWATATTWCS